MRPSYSGAVARRSESRRGPLASPGEAGYLCAVRAFRDPETTVDAPPTPALRAARPGDAADRQFVLTLARQAFARLGDYDAILGGWYDHPSVHTTLAELDGHRLGFVMWACVDREPDGPTPRVADVLGIAVAPDRQRRGLGRTLLRAALVQACALAGPVGARRFELSVAEDNPAAAALFASEGFVRRLRDDGRYPSGQRCLRLSRPLVPPAESGVTATSS